MYYRYWRNGNRISQSMSNGATTEYTYNIANLVTSMANRHNNRTLSRFDYTYFLDGNISTVAEILEGATRNITYTYDAARRLIREAGEEQITEYTFDARGNRIQMEVKKAEENNTAYYIYDLNNRLTSENKGEILTSRTWSQLESLEKTWDQIEAEGLTWAEFETLSSVPVDAIYFTYDNNGNELTRATTGQGTETKIYNAFNQRMSVSRPIGAGIPALSTIYSYRADGLRNSTTVNGVTTMHGWDRGDMVMERNAGGAVTNRYHRGVNHLIRSDLHGWYLSNARGDIAQRINAQGSVTNTYRYTSFGNELNQNSNDTNPFRFAGEYFERNTGTYYLRARNYNPAIGRFTQPDPFWNVGNMIYGSNPREMNNRLVPNPLAIMQAGNLYVYAMNNPVRFIDPSGLWTQEVHERLTRGAMSLIGLTRGRESMFNYHANHIVRGNLSIDERPYWAINVKGDASSRHFNRNATGTDSRIEWGEYYLNRAVSTWLRGDVLYASGDIDFDGRYELRAQALFYLGRGTHSIQDIDAHLDFGRSTIGSVLQSILGIDTAPIHRVTGENYFDAIFGDAIFDNPRYEVFRDEAGNWQATDSGSDFGSTRYVNSLVRTKEYIRRFYRKIGM